MKSLFDQIRTMRHGGLCPGIRELTDGNYDEDDSQTVDPSSDFGLDRFEKSEEIASQISTRMKQKHTFVKIPIAKHNRNVKWL